MRTSFLWLFALALAAGCGESPTSDVHEPTTSGELTYQRFCSSCHAAGIANAPKTGDAAAWASRIAKGSGVLLQRTIEGVPPGMPPRGLCTTCTDEELAAAIDYMVASSR